MGLIVVDLRMKGGFDLEFADEGCKMVAMTGDRRM